MGPRARSAEAELQPKQRKKLQWWIARLDPQSEKREITDVAKVPFAARSLTFDGENFWSNHRAANETVCFSLPD